MRPIEARGSEDTRGAWSRYLAAADEWRSRLQAMDDARIAAIVLPPSRPDPGHGCDSGNEICAEPFHVRDR